MWIKKAFDSGVSHRGFPDCVDCMSAFRDREDVGVRRQLALVELRLADQPAVRAADVPEAPGHGEPRDLASAKSFQDRNKNGYLL